MGVCKLWLQGEDDVLECSWNEAKTQMEVRLSENSKNGKKNRVQAVVCNKFISLQNVV